MTEMLEKALDFILRCILPLPYCETDGHRFWRKSSYESWLEAKEMRKLRDAGKLHRICYQNGYEHTARKLKDCLIEHLDEHNGKLLKVNAYHFAPCNSTYDAEYLCDTPMRKPFYLDEQYVVEWW